MNGDAEVQRARERILAAFAAMRAYDDETRDAGVPPLKLGHVYETRSGSGAVVWDLDLADVLLLAEGSAE